MQNYSTKKNSNSNIATMTNKYDVFEDMNSLEEMQKFTPNLYDDVFVFTPKEKIQNPNGFMGYLGVDLPEWKLRQLENETAENKMLENEQEIIGQESQTIVEEAAKPTYQEILQEIKAPLSNKTEETEEEFDFIEIIDTEINFSDNIIPKQLDLQLVEAQTVERKQTPIDEKVVENEPASPKKSNNDAVVGQSIEDMVDELFAGYDIDEEEPVEEEVVNEPIEEPIQEEVLATEEPKDDDLSNNIVAGGVVLTEEQPQEKTEEQVQKEVKEEPKAIVAVPLDSSYEEDAEMLKERYKTVPMDKRLESSSDSAKYYYSELKNELLSYQDTKSRMSKKFDTISIGRFTVAKITIKNDVVKLYLALVNDSLDTKYYTSDVSNSEIYDQTPTLHNVKSKRGLKYGIELIQEIMSGIGYEKNPNYQPYDYTADFKPVELAVKKEKISHLLKEKAIPEDGVLIANDVAYDILQIVKSDEYTINKFNPVNRFRVFTDDLSKTFDNGEKVTIKALQEKGILPEADNIFLEIKGRGELDKKLVVEAHSFDMVAIKMILLLDGEAVQYK